MTADYGLKCVKPVQCLFYECKNIHSHIVFNIV